MSKIRKVETNMEFLEKVLSRENLNNAYKQVYKNKGASGVDGNYFHTSKNIKKKYYGKQKIENISHNQ